MRIGCLELLDPAAVEVTSLLASVSPVIEPVEPGAYFDAGGIRRLYGDEQRFGRHILHLASEAGATARLGIGPGKFFACAAARLSDPGTLTIVADADAAGFARSLPVDWLPLTPKIQETLARLGVRTAGQFTALPQASIARRFGKEALLAHQIADGTDPRPLNPPPEVETRTMACRYEPPLVDAPALIAAAGMLVTALCRELRTEQRRYRTLRLQLEYEDGQSLQAERHLSAPADHEAAALVILPGLLSELVTAPVAAIEMTLVGLTASTGEQRSWLDGSGAAERRMRFNRAMAELQRRYPERLGTLVATSPHAALPEQRWQYAPLLAPQPVQFKRRDGRSFLQAGAFSDEIVRHEPDHEIDLWWPHKRRRRYLRLETRSGWHCTVYHDDAADGWFLQWVD